MKNRPIRLYGGAWTLGEYPEPEDYPKDVSAAMIARAKAYTASVRAAYTAYDRAYEAMLRSGNNIDGVRASSAQGRPRSGRKTDSTARKVLTREALKERLEAAEIAYVEAREAFEDVLQYVDEDNAFRLQLYCLEGRSWGYISQRMGGIGGSPRRDCAYIAIYLHMPDGWR